MSEVAAAGGTARRSCIRVWQYFRQYPVQLDAERVMEGTQQLTAGGDGAPTAMVAVPGLSGALTQGYTFLGGSGTVSMEASLRLRAKDYAAHDRWLVNLQDVITSNRLDDLWENQQVPTVEAISKCDHAL